MESYRRVCVIIIYFYASLMYFYASKICFSNLNVLLYICVLYLSIIIIIIMIVSMLDAVKYRSKSY